MKSVYVLQHLHALTGGREDVKFIGVYHSQKAALDAVDRLKDAPGFREHPKVINPLRDTEEHGFYLNEYEVDKDHWEDGFIPSGNIQRHDVEFAGT